MGTCFDEAFKNARNTLTQTRSNEGEVLRKLRNQLRNIIQDTSGRSVSSWLEFMDLHCTALSVTSYCFIFLNTVLVFVLNY